MVKKTESVGTKIFVRLLDGTETRVPCYGNILENAFAEIQENEYLDLENDETSIWEFLPGDVVSCESHEDCLLAKELVSSTVENRRVYEFIFLLVLSFGRLTRSQIESFSQEIDFLKKSDSIKQKFHPIVQKWLQENHGAKPN